MPRCALVIFGLVLFCASGRLIGAQEKTRDEPTTAKATAATPAAGNSPQVSPAEYVGTAVCEACHVDESSSFEKSPHWKTTLDTRRGAAWQGCEACHGPGSAHLADAGDKTKIFSFKTASAKSISDRCLTCHASGHEQMDWSRSEHGHNNVSCTDCHSAHHAKQDEFLLIKAQPELCYACHVQQKPQFAMPFHHRVNEGLVRCSDCHNPHGTVAAKQVRTSAAQDAVCFTCHADKRGPFVFEHEPVKVEGCESCHTPHGSPNVHMLKVSNVNLLCLSCHTTSFANAPGAPSFHNQAAQYQACTLCHTQVHGSNVDHTLFK